MLNLNERFSFDQEKAIETIVFIAQKAPIPDVYHLAKICYFADMLHLEKYGRPICGDHYIKMENGPVPSRIYNLFKAVRDFNHQELTKAFQVTGNNIEALRDFKEDEFSPSDIKCLLKSIEAHGNKSFSILKQESHDMAWHNASDNKEISYIDIINMLPNSKNLISHLNH